MVRQTKSTKDTRVLVGQAIDYPKELMLACIECFSIHERIRRAYIACVQYPEKDKPPRMVIGVDTDENMVEIVTSLEDSLKSLSLDIDVVDFVRVQGSPFENYFSKIQPFYCA